MSDSYKEILQSKDLKKSEILISVLFLLDKSHVNLKEVREKCVELGLTKAKKWNLSDVLGKASPFVIKGKLGWEITPSGKAKAVSFLKLNQKVKLIASDLRKHCGKISNTDARVFIEEAISCLEANFYRSAVVLSWTGAVAILHDHVISNHLPAFNSEASKRNVKWKNAKTSDDLGLMKEDEFLDILQSLSVLGKNVKLELKEQCLKLRNGCAHPNSLVIAENRVIVHLETLLLNIYSKF
ncbi:MAG: hypothetical protein V4654_14150 [Bdellovibrionota bacterium]